MATRSSHSSGPLVVFTQGHHSDDKVDTSTTYALFSPFKPNKPSFSARNVVPELSRKIVFASYYGWLVVADSVDLASVFLFNPFSRSTIDLPRLDILSEELASRNHYVQFVITCVPDDDNIYSDRCILMVSCKNLFLYCRPGYDTSWLMHTAHVKFDGDSIQVSRHELGVCNGVIYGVALLGNNSNNVVFRVDFDSNLNITLKSLRQVKLIDLHRSHQALYTLPYFAESNGALYYVMVSFGHGDYTDIQEVHVVKLVEEGVDETLDFVDVQGLENQAIFVGYTNSSFGCYVSPTDKNTTSFGHVQANCVYILADLGEGVIYQYHLQDHTLTTLPIFPNEKVPWRHPCWVSTTGKKRKLVKKEGKDTSPPSRHEAAEIRNNGTQFEDLPNDVIARVASHLRITEYLRFRVTCKKHKDLIPGFQSLSRETKIEYLKTTESQRGLPWLLLFKGDPKICNIIDPIIYTTDTTFLMKTPLDSKYADMEIVYAKKGWLLMHGHLGNLFYYHPFWKIMMSNLSGNEIPKNRSPTHLRCIGSSTTPYSDDGIIVGLVYTDSLFINSYFYGDQEWLVTKPPKKGSFIPTNNSPVYYKDAFYFLDIKGRLARYVVRRDLTHEWKEFKVVPRLLYKTHHMRTYLLECDGALLSVFACVLGRWIQVFRLDSNNKSWSLVHTLNNYMIFLSPSSSFATPTPIDKPELGNKLYFSRLYENHGVVCYDLGSQKYCSANFGDNKGKVIGQNFLHTGELLGGTWIDPNWF